MATRMVFIDLETTGLVEEGGRITEIAAYCPDDNSQFCTLVNPGVPIPDRIIKLCGITNEMVKDQPQFKDVFPNFIDFCRGSGDKEVTLIAHNYDGFDGRILDAECSRQSLSMPKWKTIDSLKIAKQNLPKDKSHSLESLRKKYGIDVKGSHRALKDTLDLYQIFKKLIVP